MKANKTGCRTRNESAESAATVMVFSEGGGSGHDLICGRGCSLTNGISAD